MDDSLAEHRWQIIHDLQRVLCRLLRRQVVAPLLRGGRGHAGTGRFSFRAGVVRARVEAVLQTVRRRMAPVTHDGKRYVTPLRFTVPATLLLTGSAVAADVARNDGGWNIKELLQVSDGLIVAS